MNYFTSFFLIAFIRSSLVESSSLGEHSKFMDLFNEWRTQFNIQVHDDSHFYLMFESWKMNHRYINEINSQNLSYTLGHNQFSGMDDVEFSNYLMLNSILYDTRYNRPSVPMDIQSASSVSVPSSIDWVAKGAVTPVKDQGNCGSCWSFSTTGALEGAYFVKYGTQQSFSEQQLVDCDTFGNGGKDHGCNGGLMDNAFSWITKNGGLCKESDYPYVSGTTTKAGTCQTTCKLVSGSKVVKFVDVPPSSDSSMMSALAQQPVSIAIQADQQAFQLYKSGVFTGTCGTSLDHGVLAVGYGTDGGKDYYKVKNSWGTSWGEGGYIRLGRGDMYNSGDGQCGMLLESSYPVL